MKLWRSAEEAKELRNDAALVCELFQKWEELPGHRKRQESYEAARIWFEKKHHCDWRGWASEYKGRGK